MVFRGEFEAAVVGYEALLPGALNALEAWNVLISGKCTVSELPEDRWSSVAFLDPSGQAPGRSYTRRAGVLADPFSFDANYFGIAPKDAEQIDPQQRILAETTARAFDHAGIDPDALDPRRVGVYVGASGADNSATAYGDFRLAEASFMLGNTLSIMANRISFLYDFQGPSYTVDTACSSSLFALHQARQAIAQGEIDTAVVAGVNLLLSPLPFVAFSRAGMLSRLGLCQPFAAGADGYVRSEGAVVFILQRASIARQSGLRVRSTLVGSGVNSDGRTNGIALPSSARQQALIAEVIETSGLDPEDVAFVEAHGTGTQAGDPRETAALGATYGAARSTPLPIGSAKSNFGHLEPASGLVGLLKAQMALEHGVIPASLHAAELNPDIDFEGLNLEVVRENRDLNGETRRWHAAVSSFGFGGANAHAVLRKEPSPVPALSAVPVPDALLLTAATQEALRTQAETWRDLCASAPEAIAARAATANHRRSRHRHRLCLQAGSSEQLEAALGTWLAQGDGPQAQMRVSDGKARRVIFVFGGNGSVWEGMARHMYLTDAVFREAFQGTCATVREMGGPDLTGALMAPGLAEKLEEAGYVQPLLFAIQLALVEALAVQGVRPAATLGHSVGEVAAAVTAGRIGVRDGIRIILQRSAALEPLRGTGGMAALSASRAVAQELIGEMGLALDVAAENAPESVTLSGPEQALRGLLKRARKKRLAGVMLGVDYPYHGRALDGVAEVLQAGLAGITNAQSGIGFYSGCMGERADDVPLDGTYWWRNARDPVAFRGAIEAAIQDRHGVLVEISPRTVLAGYIRDTARDLGLTVRVVEGLDKHRAEDRSAVSIARDICAAGAEMDETPLLGPRRPFQLPAPEYPFTRSHIRLESDGGFDVLARRPHHLLLGNRRDSSGWVWTGSLSVERSPWLADHKVNGRVIFPAAGIVEMFATAAREILSSEAVELRNVEFLRPVDLGEQAETGTRVRYEPVARRLILETQNALGWIPAASASVYGHDGARIAVPDLEPGVSTAGLYPALRDRGLDYGPAFALCEGYAATDGHVDARIAESDGAPVQARVAGFDALLHASAALLPDADGAFLPSRIERLSLVGDTPLRAGRLVLRGSGSAHVQLDLVAVDDELAGTLSVEGLDLRQVPATVPETDLLWEEIEIAFGPGPDVSAAVLPLSEDEAEAPAHGRVIRDAVAGRLAWDIAGDAAECETGTHHMALRLLQSLGLTELDAERQPRLEPCPWPALEELTSLLATGVQGESDLLWSILAASERRGFTPLATLNAAARAVFERLPEQSFGRVVLCGPVDAATVDACERVARILVVWDPDRSLKALVGEAGRTRFVTDAARLEGADLLVALGQTGRDQGDVLSGAARTATPGAQAVLIDEAPDMLACLKAGGDYPADHEALARGVFGREAEVQSILQRDLPGIGIRSGLLPCSEEARVPGCEVLGEGQEANRIRGHLQEPEAAPEVSLIPVGNEADASDLARAATHLGDCRGGAIWLLCPRTDRDEVLAAWRRVAANETGRDIRSARYPAGTSVERVLEAIGATTEKELKLGDDGAATTRVRRIGAEEAEAGGGRLQLQAAAGVGGRRLSWKPVARRAPETGEVEIAVRAAGLNFRDLMLAQSSLPAEAFAGGFAGEDFGMECAGTIIRSGPGSQYEVGDKVVALSSGAMATHVTVPDDVVVPLPEHMSFAVGAGQLVAFLTADYALRDLARVEPGERVLIHGAAGGVGMAATQIALRLGAEVIATAGSPEKRRLLRSLGVDMVLDSRSAAFEGILQKRFGDGVDVVVNSTSGETMERSLACLAPFGRFVELGKRDFYGNTPVGIRPLRQNISYFGVDIDQLVARKRGLGARVLKRVQAELESESWWPLPCQVFDPRNVEAAFQLMQQSRHLGKIVVEVPEGPEARAPAEPSFEGGWLVTGGSGGFGLETAEWLAAKGAGRLWLVSRSGTLDPDANARIEAEGCQVTAIAADVTDAEAMAAVMASAASDEVPLSGIVHAAAHMEDAPLRELDEALVERVTAPKVSGAEVLDALSREHPVRHFWLFSSLAARIGNPGQAAYAGANAALEAIARRRREDGLPALAIAWGPIGDAGYLNRNAAVHAYLSQRLGRLMTAREAFEGLERALRVTPDRHAITIAPVEWERLAQDLAVIREPLFELVFDQAEMGSAEQLDIAGLIEELGIQGARQRIVSILSAELGQILRIPGDEIDPDRPLSEHGFDSLMATQLKLVVEERVGVDLPMSFISDGLSLSRITYLLVNQEDAPRDTRAQGMDDRHLAGTDISAETRERILRDAGVGEGV